MLHPCSLQLHDLLRYKTLKFKNLLRFCYVCWTSASVHILKKQTKTDVSSPQPLVHNFMPSALWLMWFIHSFIFRHSFHWKKHHNRDGHVARGEWKTVSVSPLISEVIKMKECMCTINYNIKQILTFLPSSPNKRKECHCQYINTFTITTTFKNIMWSIQNNTNI